MYIKFSLFVHQIWYDVSVNDLNEAFVLEKRRVKGDFHETLELQSFPFDVQVRYSFFET